MPHINPALWELLQTLSQKHDASKTVLFGSRARGDHHNRSDIDLAVYGMPEGERAAFSLELDELPTLLKFDVVYITPKTAPALIKNIEKDGVVLYEKE